MGGCRLPPFLEGSWIAEGVGELDEGTALPYILGMIFIETSNFTKLLPKYLADEDYRALQAYLLIAPEVGDLIRGSGGVRKVRWAQAGEGKSGGIRVIYYLKESQSQIWMLTLYRKSEHDSIPGHLLKKIVEALKND